MTKQMLIDAAHAEETRVVVVDGHRIEELDFESQARKQLRGNIYLAKVTRVEPSLQAAFVEYGGNRHGFLAFNEIHPDYYQIPIADREALLREEAEEEDEPVRTTEPAAEGEEAVASIDEDDDDFMEQELERRRRRLMRRYKIQEVVRRRQIMLVQVVKEERGNKGAALTTYLSLAGRYCVLMPNTARGGGISRKITNAPDRKRLKTAAQSLDVPQGMGLIIRTAGASRTKPEIKRDYEYLLRLWENIRETTLQSSAPALIYEEEDLVKRAIRDMFDKDLDGIVVEGERGYREARDFMRMIMPSQAKKIQHYREPTPLFVKYKIEDQLAQIHQPTAALRSGGYIVINQTEALVAIDVNSGRATRERNIEATALKTNMEAAEEAVRQLRLRDLAGLIVIDFIDMEEGKNNRAVEKRLKDCLKDDRARVQMGKISPFGLMEISRQRRRTGVLEGTTHVCEHCQGTGRVRSVESSALAALRSIEVEAARGGAGAITVRLPTAVGLYVLNEKRSYLARLEDVRSLKVSIVTDEALAHADVEIERTSSEERPPELAPPAYAPARLEPMEPPPAVENDEVFDDEAVEDEEEAEEEEVQARAPSASRNNASEDANEAGSEGDVRRRRRRRRRGRRGDEPGERLEARDGGEPGAAVAEEGDDEAEPGEGEAPAEDGYAVGDADGGPRRRRRRGRRGGRKLRDEPASQDPYAWVHAHGGQETPHDSEDPYAWRDPHAPDASPQDRRVEAQAAPLLRREARQDARPAAGGDAQADQGGADPYVWTQADGGASADAEPQPEIQGDRERSRRRRSRGGRSRWSEREPAEDQAVAAGGDGAEIAAGPVDAEPTIAQASIEPESEVAPQSQTVDEAADPAPVAEHESGAAASAPPASAPAPTLAVANDAPPPQPTPPDPAEISSPPAQPKRGWWRRG